MTAPERPIGEDDLHAYVDDQLEPARRRRVEQYLVADQEAAQRVSAYQAQRQALRDAFAALSAEPLPPELSLTRILEQRLRRPRAPWHIAAAIVLALGIGGGGGWFLHSRPTDGRLAQAMDVLQREALSTHVVYATDRRHPVEVSAVEETHLKQWLSNRLERNVTPPDLSGFGFRLIGGRLLATERGRPAALFMYDNAEGDRLSLLLRPMAPGFHALQTDMSQAGLNGCAWIDRGLGYAIVGPFADNELDRMADQIRADSRLRG